MRQVVILVEGQTEETLVNEVLNPAASMRGTYVTPVVVTTSATPTGAHHGGGHWKHYHAKLQALLGAPHWHRVGLLLDYYQYPKGTPGREEATPSGSLGSAGRQSALMAALRAEYPDPRFRPLVVLHEIEALVLAAVDAGQGEAARPLGARERGRRRRAAHALISPCSPADPGHRHDPIARIAPPPVSIHESVPPRSACRQRWRSSYESVLPEAVVAGVPGIAAGGPVRARGGPASAAQTGRAGTSSAWPRSTRTRTPPSTA